MKYVKWHLVDAVTGMNSMGFMTKNGLTHPNISGLDLKITDDILNYGTVPDTYTTRPSGSDVTEISIDELNSELSVIFDKRKLRLLDNLWNLAKSKREHYVGSGYHFAEISAGVIKNQEALLVIDLDDEVASAQLAPMLATEANFRGISIKELAGLVINKYNAFTSLEAMIAGHCGAVADEINSCVFEPVLIFDNFQKLSIDINTGWPV